MNKSYGLSIGNANTDAFSCGLFDCVEYCRAALDTPEAYELIEDDVSRLSELSKEYGVSVRSFHLPFGTTEYFRFIPAALDKNVRKETFENTKRLTELVEPLGIKYLIIHASLRVVPEERQRRLDCFVEYAKHLCDYVAPLGISVAVETLKPRCLGNGLFEHLYMQKHVERDNFGICFDSNHLLSEDNIDFLNAAGQYVISTHFSDFDGVDERHWFPGRGINDWKSIVTILEEKGYAGPYVFEVNFSDTAADTEGFKKLISEWEQLFD